MPATLIPGKTVTGCLSIDDTPRNYRLFTPTTYKPKNAPSALLIGLHGGSGTPKTFERYSRFSKLSESSGKFIAIYPEGINKHWNDGRTGLNKEIDDLKFLQQLPKHLVDDLDLHLDQQKIYVTGMSNGGLMALRIACEQTGWVAGIGVVAATMPTELAKQCTPNKPVPIAFLFGRNDTSFLPDGRQVNPVKPAQLRGHHIGIHASIAFWHDHNRCQSQSRPTQPLDRYRKKWGKWKDDHTQVFIEQHQGCRAPVMWVDIRGGGHRWPDPSAGNNKFLVKMLGLGSSSHELSAADTLWTFFETGR